MELYHWPMSHNARKARALAKHLNVDVTEIVLSMQDKDHKKEDFLAINPMGQVPAIKDGEYAVWEANAVLIYLAAQSSNDLLGQSAQEWGSITQWMLWQSTELSAVVPALHVENYFKRVRGIDPDAPSGGPDAAIGPADSRSRGRAPVSRVCKSPSPYRSVSERRLFVGAALVYAAGRRSGVGWYAQRRLE